MLSCCDHALADKNIIKARKGNRLMSLIVVENLVKSVQSPEGELTILDQVSFQVHAKETVAIVGASGAGKSSLLAILAGLDLPSHGRVMIDKQDLFQLNEDQRAQLRGEKVGFVFQSFQLLASLTALENVALNLELNGFSKTGELAKNALQRVGLEHRFHHYPRQLSGGEQQRVAIARAFVTSPQILYADEPTGNLDRRTGAKIIDLIFKLNEELGTTLLLVTHDSALAERCNKQLHLEAGQLLDAEPA